jgi:hypothetical protein
VVQTAYRSEFDIPENIFIEIGAQKLGEKVKLLVGYEVVERTKNYTIIRASSLTPYKTKRVY